MFKCPHAEGLMVSETRMDRSTFRKEKLWRLQWKRGNAERSARYEVSVSEHTICKEGSSDIDAKGSDVVTKIANIYGDTSANEDNSFRNHIR
jgi:hypothetical protein